MGRRGVVRSWPAAAVVGLTLLLAASQVAASQPILATAIPNAPWLPASPSVKAGIIMFDYEGATWNHPTRQATQGMELLGSYDLTGDRDYLALAERNATYLIGRSSRIDGALWFGFDFPWNHGASTLLQPPWYSGLTQGKVLALFSRLYEHTGEPRWRAAADATFASFLVPRQIGHPWVTLVDAEGQTWLEEYPSDGPPDMVLNGHMGAIFGLWEYWVATRNPDAETLIWQATAALKFHLHEFRNPGAVSYYGLRFHAQHRQYHFAHIEQLKIMASITGDAWFTHQAALFTADTAAPLPFWPLPKRWLAAVVGFLVVATVGGVWVRHHRAREARSTVPAARH